MAISVYCCECLAISLCALPTRTFLSTPDLLTSENQRSTTGSSLLRNSSVSFFVRTMRSLPNFCMSSIPRCSSSFHIWPISFRNCSSDALRNASLISAGKLSHLLAFIWDLKYDTTKSYLIISLSEMSDVAFQTQYWLNIERNQCSCDYISLHRLGYSHHRY